jgi:hypothetical protein
MGDGWSTPRPGRSTPGKDRGTHCIGGWVFLTKCLCKFYVRIISATLFFAFRNVHGFAYIEKKAPENSKFHKSLQDCGFSVLNQIHVTLLVTKIWRRHLYVIYIWGHLTHAMNFCY